MQHAIVSDSLEALKEKLVACAANGAVEALTKSLSAAAVEALLSDWSVWARRNQLPPGGDWTTWVVLGGRGAGKTRAGAEWVRGMAMGQAPFATQPTGRIAFVGESYADAREIMVEGVSGILAISPRWERPVWQASRRRLEWSNGAVAQLFSASDPEGLRGPQFGAAWCDELAKWNEPDATWDMLQFGLRLGTRPRQMVTTTPRPVPLVRRLLEDPHCAVTKMATAENVAHLAPEFMRAVVGRYEGTRLGRQELGGELIEDRDDALWSRATIDANRVRSVPRLVDIVVALDPPATSGPRADACGMVAAGRSEDGTIYVLSDWTVRGVTPSVWAQRAVELFRASDARRIVVEVNQGGEMVKSVIGHADPTVPVEPVRATKAKWVRAEPVAMLYEQGRIRHVGTHAGLEDEMCNFASSGTSKGRSPDRIDALVWAVASLAPDGAGSAPPRVRRFG